MGEIESSTTRPALMRLATPAAGSGVLAAWPAERRRALLRKLEAGELAELTFDAVVYRQGKNANHVRFREQDMEAFAASFVGAPFLRNHDTADIGSRDGTVIASSMQGGGEGAAMRQTIRLTTPRYARLPHRHHRPLQHRLVLGGNRVFGVRRGLAGMPAPGRPHLSDRRTPGNV